MTVEVILPQKRVYTPPTLTTYGTMGGLTKNGVGSCYDDKKKKKRAWDCD